MAQKGVFLLYLYIIQIINEGSATWIDSFLLATHLTRRLGVVVQRTEFIIGSDMAIGKEPEAC